MSISVPHYLGIRTPTSFVIFHPSPTSLPTHTSTHPLTTFVYHTHPYHVCEESPISIYLSLLLLSKKIRREGFVVMYFFPSFSHPLGILSPPNPKKNLGLAGFDPTTSASSVLRSPKSYKPAAKLCLIFYIILRAVRPPDVGVLHPFSSRSVNTLTLT